MAPDVTHRRQPPDRWPQCPSADFALPASLLRRRSPSPYSFPVEPHSMALAILCSGQGRQHPNMFALTGDVPEAASLFARATALLDGRDPREFVRTATSEVLHHNRTGQILCSLQALAAATALRRRVARQSGRCRLQRRRGGGVGCRRRPEPDRHAGPRRHAAPMRWTPPPPPAKACCSCAASPASASTDFVSGTTPPLPSSIRAPPSSSEECAPHWMPWPARRRPCMRRG